MQSAASGGSPEIKVVGTSLGCCGLKDIPVPGPAAPVPPRPLLCLLRALCPGAAGERGRARTLTERRDTKAERKGESTRLPALHVKQKLNVTVVRTRCLSAAAAQASGLVLPAGRPRFPEIPGAASCRLPGTRALATAFSSSGCQLFVFWTVLCFAAVCVKDRAD